MEKEKGRMNDTHSQEGVRDMSACVFYESDISFYEVDIQRLNPLLSKWPPVSRKLDQQAFIGERQDGET